MQCHGEYWLLHRQKCNIFNSIIEINNAGNRRIGPDS